MGIDLEGVLQDALIMFFAFVSSLCVYLRLWYSTPSARQRIVAWDRCGSRQLDLAVERALASWDRKHRRRVFLS